MPRIGFEADNKVDEVDYKYPKLHLERGEVARIIAGLENPQMEYVHNLEKPVVINGRLQMETRQGQKGEYEAIKTQFVTRTICLGDFNTLQDQGSDPKNCPICKLASDNPDMAKPPYRRYAMHVMRYRTVSPGKFDLSTPFNVECLVWSFGDRIFNKLTDFATEHGDLRKKDLLLGPCENKSFQKFDIAVGAKAEWMADKDRQRLVAETFRHNQIKDLTVAIGSTKKASWLQQDIKSVIDAWNEVNTGGGKATALEATSLDEDLNDLLSDKPAAEPIAEVITPTAVPADDFDDLDSLLGDDVPMALDSTPAAPATAEADVDNFDDLLAGLD